MTQVVTQEVTFQLNGHPVSVPSQSGQSLLDLLRNTLQLKATRMGCGQGQCGACRVMLDGHAVAACETPVWAIEGKSVTTVEGLGQRSAPHALQTAFIEEQAMQCGFCTSGILMSAAALLQRQPQPSRQDIVQAIDGHLCRCGAHNRVVRAIEKAAARLATP
ncbi:(2Fe-2S)-binding protein [Limnohabitans sp. 2KL-3]|mgnify:FL=1|jgi:nicotinate dehydrogenase subunit A|uniref:(2Fe-2S)-binding protein n=1 Tax=Limnohabitans sp. 2KL-3 TaxID=1100700 RepID=UPI000AEEF637|nr:(2Fe-2S)-binding protein [Limnohabitans sp. 2KL-3]